MRSVPLDVDTSAVVAADWVEIQLASKAVPRLSIDDLADHLREDPAAEDSSDEETTGDTGKWNRARELAEEAFGEMRSRAEWLRSQYPIEFENDEVAAWVDFSPTASTYAFLVLVRAKQMIGGSMNGGRPDPGYLFEELMTEAAGAYAGPPAVRFGDADGSRGGGLPQDLAGAVRELAKRMNEKPAANLAGQGDYLADSIAWRPFGDGQGGQLVLLAQATITEGDWRTKEIPLRWQDGRLIEFVARPLPAVGFVETLSLYSTDFFRGAGFWSVPFDRLRILSLVSDESVDPVLLKGMQEWTAWAVTRLPE